MTEKSHLNPLAYPMPESNHYALHYTYTDETVNVSLTKHDPKTGEYIKQNADCTGFVTYEPLGGFVPLNDALYYLGVDYEAQKYEELLIKFDLETNQTTIIRKAQQGNQQIIGIVVIENEIHIIMVDNVTNRYGIAEISEDNQATEVEPRELKSITGNGEINSDSCLYRSFQYDSWLYDPTSDTITGSGEYYNSATARTHSVAYWSSPRTRGYCPYAGQADAKRLLLVFTRNTEMHSVAY